MNFDFILTAIANSDAKARKAYRESYRKMSAEFDAAINHYDTVGGTEARDAVFSEYRRILSRMLSDECCIYTTWYCYLAIRPHTKALRKKMEKAITDRFGTDVFDGELNLLVILATADVNIAKRRGELKRLRSVSFPNGLNYVKEGSFDFLRLRYLYIPDSVREIERYAFLGCKIRHLSIGVGVEKIGEGAFGAGRKILHIKYRGHRQEWESRGFSDIVSPWMKIIVDCLDGKIVIKEKSK